MSAPSNSSREPLHPLLLRARGGDEAALEALLVRAYRIARAFVRRRLPGSQWDLFVEDAASETVMRVAEHIDSCRAASEGAIVLWILSIARTATIDLHQQELRRVVEVALADVDISAHPEATEGFASAAEEALLQVLVEVHDGLPEDLQVLLWARLVHGATWLEAAEEVGSTAAGAKRRFQRAQARLRRELTHRIHMLPGRRRMLVLERLAALGVRI